MHCVISIEWFHGAIIYLMVFVRVRAGDDLQRSETKRKGISALFALANGAVASISLTKALAFVRQYWLPYPGFQFLNPYVLHWGGKSGSFLRGSELRTK